jgi:hypothetical protein
MTLLSTRLREERRWANHNPRDLKITITLDTTQVRRAFDTLAHQFAAIRRGRGA